VPLPRYVITIKSMLRILHEIGTAEEIHDYLQGKLREGILTKTAYGPKDFMEVSTQA
jgi:hypothetical protein